MKLTFPVLTLSRGGAQRMITELANRLAEIGHEVVVLMPSLGIVEYEMKCPIIPVPAPVLTEDHFPYGDVIISNYYTTVPVAERASRQGKGLHIRLALCYEPNFLPDNNQSFASYGITRNLLVLSRWQQEVIRINHGIKGRIVPVGVDPDFHNTHFRDNPNRPLIVSAIMRRPEGGFSGHREQDYLIQQLDMVKRLHPEVEIYIMTPLRNMPLPGVCRTCLTPGAISLGHPAMTMSWLITIMRQIFLSAQVPMTPVRCRGWRRCAAVRRWSPYIQEGTSNTAHTGRTA